MVKETEPHDFAQTMVPEVEVPAPAFGYSILANVGDERQMTVQCYADGEEDISLIHRKIDKAMAVVDRQKAKYRLKDLRKEVADMQETCDRQHDDLARLEENFAANQEALNASIADCQAGLQALQDGAHARGRAKPVGQEAAKATALGREINQLAEQRAAAAAERESARQNMAVNIGRFNDAIAKKNAEIAECEALVAEGG